MPRLVLSREAVARKWHTCFCCGFGAIAPGQRYVRESYAYDGRLYAVMSCLECREVLGDVWEWCARPDEGVGPAEYDAWAREHMYRDPRAAKYLSRLGVDMRQP